MSRIILFAIAAWVILAPDAASAHGGGLDAQGCHHNRKAGGYHCHRGPLSGQSFGSKHEALRSTSPARSEVISGIPRVIDGDTLKVDGKRIRLFGIDAPELKQTCRDERGEFPCGQHVKRVLTGLLVNKKVSCNKRDVDRYGRIVAVCYYKDGVDVGRDLVRYGWAMAYQKYSSDYVDDEKRARQFKFGLWVSQFIPPWEWRRR